MFHLANKVRFAGRDFPKSEHWLQKLLQNNEEFDLILAWSH